jgi:hypothetical protein
MPSSNRFDRMACAGAFGDSGTLIPFVVAYIAVVKMDPFGSLFSFDAALVACGLYYKTRIASCLRAILRCLRSLVGSPARCPNRPKEVAKDK